MVMFAYPVNRPPANKEAKVNEGLEKSTKRGMRRKAHQRL